MDLKSWQYFAILSAIEGDHPPNFGTLLDRLRAITIQYRRLGIHNLTDEDTFSYFPVPLTKFVREAVQSGEVRRIGGTYTLTERGGHSLNALTKFAMKDLAVKFQERSEPVL